MPKLLTDVLAVLLVLHGLIHLMGLVVYMRLGRIEGLDYKTTLLGGIDLHDLGTRIFGLLWALPALGFVAAAVALWAGWPAWQALLVGVTMLSLVLTTLDWAKTYAGAVIDVVILGAVWMGPRVLPWIAR